MCSKAWLNIVLILCFSKWAHFVLKLPYLFKIFSLPASLPSSGYSAFSDNLTSIKQSSDPYCKRSRQFLYPPAFCCEQPVKDTTDRTHSDIIIYRTFWHKPGQAIGNKYRQFLKPVEKVWLLGDVLPRKQPSTTGRYSHGYHSKVDKINLKFSWHNVLFSQNNHADIISAISHFR